LVPEPRSLPQRLKTETRPHHERAERVVRLMDPGLTVDGYRRHLEALYGFYGPVEAALAVRLGDVVPDLRAHERWKLPLLEKDLASFGHTPASLARLPRASRPPSPPGVPEALGGFYVLEGATLGGQLLLRHLTRHFEGQAVGDFAFFRAYGEAVGPMWKAFGETLVRASAEAASDFDDRVIQGAKDMFAGFEAWLLQEAGHAAGTHA
jgi:heme oxygenase